jgi:hypothetical protein
VLPGDLAIQRHRQQVHHRLASARVRLCSKSQLD